LPEPDNDHNQNLAPLKSNTRETRPGRWGKRVVYLALTIVVLYFVGKALFLRMEQISWADLTLKTEYAVCGVLLLALCPLFTGLAFTALVTSLGGHAGMLKPATIQIAASLGRYIPGKVVSITGQSMMLARMGVRVPITVSASLLMVALTVAITLLLSLPLAWHPALRDSLPAATLGFVALGACCVVCLYPPIFLRLINFLLKKLGCEAIVSKPIGRWLWLGAAMVLTRHLALAGGVIMTANAITPVEPHQYLVIAATANAASVIGFLAVFAPAGIGVREGVYLLALEAVLGGGTAAILAILVRMFQTCVDVIMSVAAVILLLIWRRRARRNTPPPTS